MRLNDRLSDGCRMSQHDREGAWRLTTPGAHREYYDAWAASYEDDFLTASGYLVPGAVARVFSQQCGPADSPVADLGCGTGALGRALQRTDVEGFDISPGMLDQARRTGAYRALHCVDLTSAEPDHRYGGLVSSGTFTMGHLGPEGLEMLLRLAAPGALAVIGINAKHFSEGGFAGALSELAGSGRITEPIIEQVASYPAPPVPVESPVESPVETESSTCIVVFRVAVG